MKSLEIGTGEITAAGRDADQDQCRLSTSHFKVLRWHFLLTLVRKIPLNLWLCLQLVPRLLMKLLLLLLVQFLLLHLLLLAVSIALSGAVTVFADASDAFSPPVVFGGCVTVFASTASFFAFTASSFASVAWFLRVCNYVLFEALH